MRVIFVTHNYPRFSGDVSGNFLHPLACALQERGHEVRVVAPSDAGKGGDDVLDGVSIRRVRYAAPEAETLAYRGTMAAALKSATGMKALGSLVRNFTAEIRSLLTAPVPTVVHAHWWFPAALSVPREVPTVVTCHGTDLRLLDTSRLVRLIGKRVLRRMTRVTTVSHFLAEIVTRRTGRAMGEDDIQPMPIVQVPRPLSSGGGGILLVGRLAPQKRIDLALQGIAAATGAVASLPITVVGDGPNRDRLIALADSLGLSRRITFVGAVASRDVPHYFATADVCVMTAYREGLGLGAAEALIQGVPTIACQDGGGVLDVVPSSGGGRVVAAEASAIAGALGELIANPSERHAARRLGESWERRLSPAATVAACERWYDGLVGA